MKKEKDNYAEWYALSMCAPLVLDPTRVVTGGGTSKKCTCPQQISSESSYDSGRSASRFNGTSFAVGVAIGTIF